MSYVMHLVGWVALQCAWQTVAVALLLVFSSRLMRGASASHRYRCAVLHLVWAIGAVILTLIASQVSVALARPLESADLLHRRWLPSLQDQTGEFLPTLAWIWLLGIAVAQLLLALRLHRLRHFLNSSKPAPRHVTAMVEALCRVMGVSRPPQVLCADIGSPMVAGERSAVLVVPRTFGESYPQAEMRALLAHELAHIMRRDYSRNVLQLFAMSLMWWHPGAWLIYARIRHERECASDEHALRHIGSPASLACALFRLADAQRATDAVAVAASSSGLADRISRIMEPQECQGPRNISHFFAAAFVAFAVIIAVSSSTASKSESLTRSYASSAIGPNTVFTIHAHDPAGSFLVKMVRGRVLGIEMEYQPVPSDRVVQRGHTVRIMGAAGQELLRLEVDPRGGFSWTARRASQ